MFTSATPDKAVVASNLVSYEAVSTHDVLEFSLVLSIDVSSFGFSFCNVPSFSDAQRLAESFY